MPLQVELVSPERSVWSGEADAVIVRTLGGGDICFLPGHAPFLGALVENHTRISLADGSVLDLAVHGGFVQVSGTTVSILSDQAEMAGQIDRQRAQRAKERAEEILRKEHDAEAAASLARAHARLNATGGIGTAAGAH